MTEPAVHKTCYLHDSYQDYLPAQSDPPLSWLCSSPLLTRLSLKDQTPMNNFLKTNHTQQLLLLNSQTQCTHFSSTTRELRVEVNINGWFQQIKVQGVLSMTNHKPGIRLLIIPRCCGLAVLIVLSCSKIDRVRIDMSFNFQYCFKNQLIRDIKSLVKGGPN